MLRMPGRMEIGHDAWLLYEPAFVPDHRALMDALWAKLPLVQEPLRIFGRSRLTPRLTSFHGDPECHYRYSGRTFSPRPWTPELAELRTRLRALTGYDFNAVLANAYRDGSDSMSAHSDDEPELGPKAPHDVVLASVSLGARRRFILQGNEGDQREVFELGEGDLLVMGGATQQLFSHSVPKTAQPVGPRLNLTYRIIVSAGETAKGSRAGEAEKG